jgi:hypothetical protein
MSHRRTVRSNSSRTYRRIPKSRQLYLGTLEDRLAPAVFTGVGPALAIDLNSANEIATFSTDGTTVTVQLTNGTATTTGTSVTGGGTSTATFSSATYSGLITITDSAAGTSVAFANSTGAYPQSFAITLNDPASGNISFTGSSTFNQTFNASTTAGRFASNLTSSLTLSGGTSNLSLTATGHDILLAGALNIGGTTAFNGVTVQADNSGNDFVGSLTLNGPAIASVFDVNALDLAASNFNFAVNTTVQITANGNITQSGPLTGAGLGTVAITSLAGSINLPDTGNALPNSISVALSASGANNVTFYNGATTQLGNISLGTGTLNITSIGNIRQAAGTTIQTGGALALTIDLNNNRNITLLNAGNRIAGAVTVAGTGGGDLQDFSLRNAADNASLPTGTPFTTAGDIRNLTLFFDNNGMSLPGYDISNNLTLTAGGDITQTAGLTVPGTTTVTILGDFAITLTNAANNFSGAVSLNAPQSTQPLQVTNSVALTLGASDLGRGTFNATAVTGNINSTAAITQRKGALLPTFTVSGGNTVSLTGANDFPGPVALVGAGLTTVSVRNADFQAKVTDITGTLPATVTDLTLTFDNAAAVLPAITINNLTVTALGIVQQSGTSLVISGSSSFSAGAYALNLSNSANDFNDITLSNSGRNDVAVTDANALTFQGNSTIGTGRLTVTAAGNIGTLGAGRITQASSGPVGDVTLTSTGGSITLNNNNAFRGVLSASVTGVNNISVNNNNVAMVLGSITTAAGSFNVTVTGGANSITQDPNSVLGLGGSSSFTAGNSITLTNRTNTFTGTVALNGTNASIRATGAVTLAASNVGSTLNIKTGGTATDSITQTGAITVGSAATFDVGAGNVTLTNGGNDFGSVSVTSTGTAVSITDTNALNVGNIVLGGGTLTLNTGGSLGLVSPTTSGIVQTTGSGAITLNTAGANISLGSPVNAWLGTVAVTNANNVTLQNKGDITFAPASSINGNLIVTAGGVLTLPTTINVNTLSLSATSMTIASDITAGNSASFAGTVNFTGSRSVTSGAGVTFTGDVNAGGSLTFNLTNGGALSLNDGTWTQGANDLTITDPGATFNIGDGVNNPARLIMTGGTISIANNGAMNINSDGTLQVGNNPAASETVTVANGSGLLTINGSLGVGFGATPDELIKTGTGPIVLGASSKLVGSGLTTATSEPVLAAETYVAGRFANSVDSHGNTVDFFAGSDIVKPTYFLDHVEVKAGGTLAPSGTATGFLPDGDKFTVASSLAAAAGLATVVDPTGQLYVVVRNTTAAGASTLTFATTGGGDGQIPVGGVSVHAPGPVTVSAATSNFLGLFTTAGALAGLTARDVGNSNLNSFVLTDGGSSTSTTSITARVVTNSSFNLAGILKSFMAVSDTGTSRLTAQSFGSLTTTGLAAAGDLGNFSPNLISTTPANGTVVGSATVAGTLGGTWDVRGNVGTIKAFKTNGWTLGTLAGANIRNGGQLSGATSLTLGPVTNSNFNATGLIATMTTSDITGSTLTAGSFGKVSVVANSALALAGSIGSSTFTALGNTGGVALASLSVAGNMGLTNLNFLNGNATSITVARIVNNSVVTAIDTGIFGNVGSITAGKWQNSTIDARTLTNLKIVGNLLGGLFGDFINSTVTVRNNTLGVGLGTFSAQGSVTGSTFDIQSGNLTNFVVGRQLGTTTIKLTNPIFAVLGTVQAGDWTSGVTVLAKTIGTVASVGAAELFPASPLLLGGIALDSITAYLNGGSVASITKVTINGDFSGSTLLAERGIGTLTVGRAVTINGAVNSFIIADDALTGSPNVGRINTLTAGAMNSSTIVANSLGMVKFAGYAQPENPAATIVFGDVTSSTLVANGAGGATPSAAVGIGSLSGREFLTNSVVRAPFGIKALTMTGGLLSGSQVVTDNPAAPTAGALGTFTVGEINSATVRTGSIATMKVTGYTPLNFLGSITASTMATDSTATTKTGPQAIQSLTAAGDFQDSTIDAPATVGTIGIGGRVVSASVETRVLAGYNSGAKLGTLSAGAWGQATGTLLTDLNTRAVGTFALKGNAVRGFVGTSDRAFIDILGNSAGVGLGTFTSTGTLSNSLFRVSDGDVTSFTTLRMESSDLLVGFRPVKGSDISLAPVAANWSATNHKIGLFKTTAPFSAIDPVNSGSFDDSNVVAATLGTVSISGVDPTTINSTKFGVAFRTTGGAAGSLSIAGVSKAVNFVDGQFNFLGLPG